MERRGARSAVGRSGEAAAESPLGRLSPAAAAAGRFSGTSRLAGCELALSARHRDRSSAVPKGAGAVGPVTAGRRVARGGGRKAGAQPQPRVPAGSPGPGGREAAGLGRAGPPPLARAALQRGRREPAEWCPAAERVRLRYRGTSLRTEKGNTLLFTFFSLRRLCKGSFFLSKFAI